MHWEFLILRGAAAAVAHEQKSANRDEGDNDKDDQDDQEGVHWHVVG